MSWHNRRNLQGFELLFEALLVFSVLFVVWNLWTILYSGAPQLLPALRSQEIRSAIQLSLWTSSLSSGLCMLLALPCAYCLTKGRSALHRAFEVVLELPLSLPYLVLGLCLLTAFSSPFGKFLKSIGLRFVFDPKGIVAAHVLVNLPFAIHMLVLAFRSLNPEWNLAAQVLGAKSLQIFWAITLPLCRSALLSTLLLTWSRALGEFGATLMLVGVTRMKTETLPASIYLNVSTGETELALAAALILLILSFLIQLLLSHFNKKEPI